MLRGFVLPVLEYCFAVWCLAADTHLILLDRVVSGAHFLTGCVFECDTADCQSGAVPRPSLVTGLGVRLRHVT